MRLLIIIAIICLAQTSFGQEVTAQLARGKWLYISAENEIDIAVKGVKPENIVVTTNNGTVHRNGTFTKGTGASFHNFGVFAFDPVRPEDSMAIDIGIRTSKGVRSLKQLKLRAQCPPAPKVIFFDVTNGTIATSKARVCLGLSVFKDCYNLVSHSYRIVDCRVQVIRNQQIVFDKVLGKAAGHFQDDPEAQKIIENLKVGDKLMFTDIKYIGPCECAGDAAPVSVTLN